MDPTKTAEDAEDAKDYFSLLFASAFSAVLICFVIQ